MDSEPNALADHARCEETQKYLSARVRQLERERESLRSHISSLGDEKKCAQANFAFAMVCLIGSLGVAALKHVEDFEPHSVEPVVTRTVTKLFGLWTVSEERYRWTGESWENSHGRSFY